MMIEDATPTTYITFIFTFYSIGILLFLIIFQTHTAISKVIEIIETTEKVSFPNKERVLQAYLHFEALTNHEYTYSCVSCGYSPAVVVMDLHKKGVFNMPGEFNNLLFHIFYCLYSTSSLSELFNIILTKPLNNAASTVVF